MEWSNSLLKLIKKLFVTQATLIGKLSYKKFSNLVSHYGVEFNVCQFSLIMLNN